MQNLDTRQAAILLMLLESQTPVSAQGLGKTLGISARMVRYNLSLIDTWLQVRGASLRISPREGISIPASSETRKRLAHLLQKEEVAPVFTPVERVQMLLFEFLTQENYRRLNDVETSLSASTATLSRDLPEVEHWLKNYQLYLQRKPRQGTMLVGREIDRRHAMTALLNEVIPEMALLDYCLWGKKPQKQVGGLNPVQSAIYERIHTWRLPEIWRSLQRLDEDLHAAISDRDHLNLTIYTAFTIQRMQKGHLVEISDEQILTLSRQPVFQAVRQFAGQSGREFHLDAQPAELAQLTLELISLMDAGGEYNLAESSARQAAEMLAESVREQLNLKAPQPDALERMAGHLARAMLRLQYSLPIHNPLTAQVEAAFPDVWRATQQAAYPLQEQMGILFPREEIAFLTMYLGLAFDLTQRSSARPSPRVIVACPTGGITVWMLVQRLKQELPEIEIVDVVPLRKLTQMKLEKINAIISTAAFEYRGVPVITVNPLIDEQEVSKIRQKLALGAAR